MMLSGAAASCALVGPTPRDWRAVPERLRDAKEDKKEAEGYRDGHDPTQH